ncbi:MAG: glycosyltransferase family A protein [Cyclobacteriaceae bacterium]
MFSIIIPLYNKIQFISRAIDSVLNQTFKEYEIIVINDGSTDGGEKLVSEKYGEKIKLFHQANQGVSIARNNGIANAEYNYISFLDADDFWHKGYLEAVNSVICEFPDVGIIGTGYTSNSFESLDRLDFYLLKEYFNKAIKNTFFFTSATTIKKSFFHNNPGFDPQLKMGEDLDVWFRANLYFGDGLYISNKMVYYGNEDEQRAVNKLYLFEESLIYKIIDPKYFTNAIGHAVTSEDQFELFKEKWIYFNLFPLYREKLNKENLNNLLRALPFRLYLVSVFYRIPFEFLHNLFSNRKLSILFRNYMKFCFRFIYT